MYGDGSLRVLCGYTIREQSQNTSNFTVTTREERAVEPLRGSSVLAANVSQVGADVFQHDVPSGSLPAISLAYNATYGCRSPPPPPYPGFGCGKSFPPLSSVPPGAAGTTMISSGSGCENSGGCMAGTQAVAFEVENVGQDLIYLNAATFLVLPDTSIDQLQNSQRISLFWLPPPAWNASRRVADVLPDRNHSDLWLANATRATVEVVGDANLRFEMGGVPLRPGAVLSLYAYSWSIPRIARFNTILPSERRLIPGAPVTSDGALLIRCGYSFVTGQGPAGRAVNISQAFTGTFQTAPLGFYNQFGLDGVPTGRLPVVQFEYSLSRLCAPPSPPPPWPPPAPQSQPAATAGAAQLVPPEKSSLRIILGAVLGAVASAVASFFVVKVLDKFGKTQKARDRAA